MGFSALSAAQRLIVELAVKGGPAASAAMNTFTGSVNRANMAITRNAAASRVATKNSLMFQQAVFTARRYMFYGTAAAIGLGAAVVKLGVSYNMASQEARVALQPVLGATGQLNEEMGKLFHLAAFSPFQFKDVTVAFRQMFAGFHTLGFSIDFTNQTMQALVDSLSYAGKTTPAALNRVSVQLQHMAFVGRPTGQIITNLARDGLPIFAALHKVLKLNDDQIKNIANSGITAQQVIGALNKYVQTTAGYSGAALRIQTKTLIGAWTTFKDLLSQGAGQGTLPILSHVQKLLAGVDREINKIVRDGKPATLLDFANALDKRLTPGTHAIIDAFYFFDALIKGIAITFISLIKVVSLVTSHMGGLTKAFNANKWIMKALGYFLGVVIGLWLVYTGTIVVAKVTMGLLYFSFKMLNDVIEYTTTVVKVLTRALWWLIRTMIRVIWAIIRVTVRLIWQTGVLIANAIAWLFVNFAMLGWIAIAIALIAVFVILFIFWKGFRDTLIDAAKWIWKNWYWMGLLLNLLIPGIYIIGLLVKRWKDLKKAIEAVVGVVKKGWHWISKVAGVAAHAVHRATRAVLGPPGHPGRRQSGGPVTSSGPYVVGEIGPELLYLPGGSSVIPNNQISQHLSLSGMMGEGRPIVVQVMLDRRVLATAVAQANQDYLARK
jgi:hypothetical protein